jgi:hypothetical protein
MICADISADPRHLRWRPAFEDITKEFDGKVIFWSGTIGDTFNAHYKFYEQNNNKYFDNHFGRAARWQAVSH